MFYGYLKTNGYRYNLTGQDSSSVCSLIVSSSVYDAQQYMLAEGYRKDNYLRADRRVDIALTKVTVETGTYEDANGRSKKVPCNPDLFCRLGALMRYAKTHCYEKNRVDYMGLDVSDNEISLAEEFTYKINYPTDDTKELAQVTLRYNNIKHLHIEAPDFELELETKDSESTSFLQTIRGGWSSVFRQIADTLGFEQNSQVVSATPSLSGMYADIAEVVKAHPEKELSWLLQKDYSIVTDDTLEQVCKYISDAKEYVYYDTETTGLNITFKSRTGDGDQLVGVVLSVKYGESYFFPTKMKSVPNLCGGDDVYFMEHYMRPILEGKELVCHNGSFDWKVAHIYGINANVVHDTIILWSLTLGRQDEKQWTLASLKHTAKVFLHRDSLELSDLVKDNTWGENDIKFWDLPAELVRLYACADTDNTMGLFQYAQSVDLLGKYGATKVYEIEVAFSLAVAYQEFYGHKLNIENVEKLKEDTHKALNASLQKIYSMVGHEFNLNSPSQLSTVLYSEMGIPPQISRKTNRVTTDKETLKSLSEITDEDDNIMYPVVKEIIEYRQLEGVRKIIDKFPEQMTSDGYLFSSVLQFGAATGRLSISHPNYQSYNDPVKKNVVPRDGYWMFDTDYSSIEYRVLGNMVGNKMIMDNFKDPDFDYHTYQAAHMYNVPYASVTKKLRKAAKGINFGLPYGMGDESLGIRVFGSASPENTLKAKNLRDAYFKGQEDIRDWFEYHRNNGVRLGYTETYFGRRRYYDKATNSVGSIKRQAGNQVIQGTAADIYKLAVSRVFKRICREGWLGKVLFTGFIHDELLGEVSNDINPGVFLKALREEFEVKITRDDGTPWCPLYMGFGYGMSWYEAKSVELPIKLQWEIVEKYGETGFPNWTGDGRAFCDTVPDMLRDFEVRDITNQITDVSAQGSEIKPALNTALIDCVKTDCKAYNKAIEDYLLNSNKSIENLDSSDISNIKGVLKPSYITEVPLNSDGVVVASFTPTSETQECLDTFCALHGVDRSKVNINNITEVSSTTSSGNFSVEPVTEEEIARRHQLLVDRAIDGLGYYIDHAEGTVTLLVLPTTSKIFTEELKKHLLRQDSEHSYTGLRLRFKRYSTDGTATIAEFPYILPSNEVDFVVRLWTMCVTKAKEAQGV